MKDTPAKVRPFWRVPALCLGIGLGLSLLALVPIQLMAENPAMQGADRPQPNTPPVARSDRIGSVAGPPPGARTIKDDSRFGCASRDYLSSISNMLAQGDSMAAENAIREGFTTGQCVPFNSGEPVYVEKFDWGLVEIRRPGQSTTYWTFTESIGQ